MTTLPPIPDGLPPATGAVAGGLRTVLRAEGFAALVVAAAAYRLLNASWGLFFALFLMPDLSFLAVPLGRRTATAAYNAAHSYALPLGVVVLATLANRSSAYPFCAIWIAHIGFDRALGYGLKYATAFEDTHLGRIGRAGPADRRV